jgi:hypothetical protein
MRAYQREKVKEAILSTISENKLVKIDAAQSGIHWVESNREFTFDGMLYDVVKQVTVNGKSLLYCISDKVEKDIIEKQESNLTGTNGKKGKDNKKGHSHSPFSDYTTPVSHTDHQYFLNLAGSYINAYMAHPCSIYKRVPAPPPKTLRG